MTPEETQRLWNSLQTLQTQQELGLSYQAATNEHLKQLNGKVAKHEDSINSLSLWRARGEGVQATLGVGWTFILAILSGAVLLIGDWYFRK
jgi:hypothetical protein